MVCDEVKPTFEEEGSADTGQGKGRGPSEHVPVETLHKRHSGTENRSKMGLNTCYSYVVHGAWRPINVNYFCAMQNLNAQFRKLENNT